MRRAQRRSSRRHGYPNHAYGSPRSSPVRRSRLSPPISLAARAINGGGLPRNRVRCDREKQGLALRAPSIVAYLPQPQYAEFATAARCRAAPPSCAAERNPLACPLGGFRHHQGQGRAPPCRPSNRGLNFQNDRGLEVPPATSPSGPIFPELAEDRKSVV